MKKSFNSLSYTSLFVFVHMFVFIDDRNGDGRSGPEIR